MNEIAVTLGSTADSGAHMKRITKDELGSLKDGFVERPAFAVAFLLFSVLAVSLLVAAAYLLGGLDSTNELLYDDYQIAVGAYQGGGATILPISAFAAISSLGAPSAISLNASQATIGSFPPFRRFSFVGRSVLPRVSLDLTASNIRSAANITLRLSSNFFNGTTSIFTLPPVPLYSVNAVSGSLHSRQRCILAGGVIQPATGACVTVSVLSSLCVQVALNITAPLPYWALNPTPGCAYPFASIGIYGSAPGVANLSLFGVSAPLSLTFLSADDPAIVMEAVETGFASTGTQRLQQRQGVAIVVTASVIIAVVLAVLIARRVWKSRQQRASSAALADITVALMGSSERGTDLRVRAHVKDSRLWLQLGGAVGLLGVGVGAGLTLISNWSMQVTFSWQAYGGLLLLLVAVPPGFSLLILFWGSVVRRQLWPYALRAAIVGISAAACYAAAGVCIALLVNPTQPIGTDPGNGDQLTIFMGIALTVITTSLGVACTAVTVRLLLRAVVRTHPLGVSTIQKTDIPVRALPSIERERTPHAIRAAIALLVVYFVLFVCSAALPPIWNVALSVYNIMPSPYSVLPWMLPSGFSVKIYPDVLAFYAFILALALVGLLRMLLHDSLGRWMGKRLRVGPASPYNVLFRFGATPGELLLVLAFLSLFGFWFWYWFASYGRIAALPLPIRLARTLGHMTAMSMSLLVLPIARDSIWQRLFGIPFDSALRFHRVLGVWVFVSLTSHMLVWNIEWLRAGTWVNNVFTIYPSHSPDDFTLPLVELAWLCMLTIVLTALPYVRKRHFEWFHYTHHLFMFVFLAALIHAWALWYFLSGSLLLWLFDRLMRFVRGTQEVELVSADVGASHVTRLVFRGNMRWYPGQYAFINVPAVSSFEWHPFTISSSPLASSITFHIKDIAIPRRLTTTAGILAPARIAHPRQLDGAQSEIDALRAAADREHRLGQFTHRLALWAGAARRAMQAGQRVTVAVDGPYGGWSGYADHTALLLIAGGVGITPLHSIYQDLVLRACADARAELSDGYVDVNTGLSTPAAATEKRAKSGSKYGDVSLGPMELNLALRDRPLPGTQVRHAHLVWVADHDNTLCVFADTMRRADDVDPTGACFTYALHSTERRDGDAGTAWREAERLQSMHAADALYGDIDPDAAAALQARIVRGRPVLRDVFAEYARTFAGERVAALVCGPEGLIASASQLCFEHGFSFFSEDFFL